MRDNGDVIHYSSVMELPRARQQKKTAETCGRVVSADGVTKTTDPVQVELGSFFQNKLPKLVALFYWKPMLRDCLVTPTASNLCVFS